MPVTGTRGSEGPGEPLQSKARLDRGIIINVGIVIVIDELMISQLTIDRQGGHDQKEASGYFPAA
jgi:hypothetical protein